MINEAIGSRAHFTREALQVEGVKRLQTKTAAELDALCEWWMK